MFPPKPLSLSILLTILTMLTSLVSALGCYSEGATFENLTGGGGGEFDDGKLGRCFGYANNLRLDIALRNVGDSLAWFGHKDCASYFQREKDGCVYGYEQVYDPWWVKVDPNYGDCPAYRRWSHCRCTHDFQLFTPKIPATYVFAITAYAHYLSTTHHHSPRSWSLEALQVVAFACFPALPIVQICNNLINVLAKIPDVDHVPGGAALRYSPAAILGFHAKVVESGTLIAAAEAADHGQHLANTTDNSPEIYFPLSAVDPADIRGKTPDNTAAATGFSLLWLGSLLGIVANLVVCTLSIVVYFRRLLTVEDGFLGLDHRLGWVAVGGPVSCLMTLAAFLVVGQHSWTIVRMLHDTYTAFESVRARRTMVMTELIIAGPIQDYLLIVTHRPSVLTVLYRGIYGIVLWVVLFAILLASQSTRTEIISVSKTTRIQHVCDSHIPVRLCYPGAHPTRALRRGGNLRDHRRSLL
ncbi:hypothetical protein B0H66DRAFT_605751 [Apodospora peruviana]|uniref:Uncharacterized protein n=1 Tax=Apodospora peruviana TaxID=516989 RepID=A0AAE0HY90_9PEZI|nr:hypothetical protein B0H66DRAFT_605751 [Apodospora peruviana]